MSFGRTEPEVSFSAANSFSNCSTTLSMATANRENETNTVKACCPKAHNLKDQTAISHANKKKLILQAIRRHKKLRSKGNLENAFNTLKVLVPEEKLPAPASTVRISKTTVLRYTAKHIQFLEALLLILFKEKAIRLGQPNADRWSKEQLGNIKGVFSRKFMEKLNSEAQTRQVRHFIDGLAVSVKESAAAKLSLAKKAGEDQQNST